MLASYLDIRALFNPLIYFILEYFKAKFWGGCWDPRKGKTLNVNRIIGSKHGKTGIETREYCLRDPLC
jgi:hypothetical protein